MILLDHQSNSLLLLCTTPQTCMSPARPRPPAASDPAATHMGIQWNLVHVPVKNISGDSSSSQFNESWPSSSELVGPSPAGESGGRQGDTLATYVGTLLSISYTFPPPPLPRDLWMKPRCVYRIVRADGSLIRPVMVHVHVHVGQSTGGSSQFDPSDYRY